ncbi:hypothetical protein MMC19_002791 [Ptychographa xylographoides]|nr:hypothetical protein [Ptychographa xylographoides]
MKIRNNVPITFSLLEGSNERNYQDRQSPSYDRRTYGTTSQEYGSTEATNSQASFPSTFAGPSLQTNRHGSYSDGMYSSHPLENLMLSPSEALPPDTVERDIQLNYSNALVDLSPRSSTTMKDDEIQQKILQIDEARQRTLQVLRDQEEKIATLERARMFLKE